MKEFFTKLKGELPKHAATAVYMLLAFGVAHWWRTGPEAEAKQDADDHTALVGVVAEVNRFEARYAADRRADSLLRAREAEAQARRWETIEGQAKYLVHRADETTSLLLSIVRNQNAGVRVGTPPGGVPLDSLYWVRRGP